MIRVGNFLINPAVLYLILMFYILGTGVFSKDIILIASGAVGFVLSLYFLIRIDKKYNES